jgi:tryptophan-rich sensory protein
MTIAILRVISSLLIWQQMNQQFLVLPFIAFAVHLALGDTWNTIFTVQRRLGAAVPVVIFGPWLSALIVTTHIPHNIIVLQEVTREYLFNLRIITYGL